MTIGEAISRIRGALKEVVGDTTFTDRFIWSNIRTVNEKLLKIESDNKRKLYNQTSAWSTICVEMEAVSSLVCNCLNLPYECVIYRSKKKLPAFVEGSMGFIYKSLTTPDRKNEILIVSSTSYKDKVSIKYNKHTYAFIEGDYLFTPDSKYPILALTGIFRDDITSWQCDSDSSTTSNKNACKSILDSESGIPSYLEEDVITLSLQKLFPTKQVAMDEHPNQNSAQILATP